MADPTSPPTSGRSWVSIESNRVLPSSDLEKVSALARAVAMLGGEVPSIAAVMHQMRDAMAGHPQAAAADRERGDQQPWCWDHERTTDQCHAAGETCGGELIPVRSDPTGNAATINDRAEAHHRDLLDRMGIICRATHDVLSLMAAYPTQPAEPTTLTLSGPGPNNCRACWSDDRTITEIQRGPDGKPYYKGLCRRCGKMRSELGGFDPPPWMVRRRRLGEKITPAMWKRAREEHGLAEPKNPTARRQGGKRGWQR